MKLLVVGSGAREHALAWKLAQSPKVDTVFAAPGNAGTAEIGENWADIAVTDTPAIVAKAQSSGIGLAVVGPEAALAAGVADALRAADIATFGPGRAGARLESSKAYAKQCMTRWGVPTPRYVVARDGKRASALLRQWPKDRGVVLKADGLAAGKGVIVCASPDEARAVAADWYDKRSVPGGGSTVVFEERLDGREVSCMALLDGSTASLLPSARDYKRAGDGNSGPNTGGMGAYSPADDVLDERMRRRAYDEVIRPAVEGLASDGIVYRGCLYAGLMITDEGPQVLEFNARFGDPEAQVVVPRLEGDLAELLLAVAQGRLASVSAVAASKSACVGVVLASEGYPAKITPLSALPAASNDDPAVMAFWGNTKPGVNASGGRVLTMCALGADVAAARAAAYAACAQYQAKLAPGVKLWCRSDIAR